MGYEYWERTRVQLSGSEMVRPEALVEGRVALDCARDLRDKNDAAAPGAGEEAESGVEVWRDMVMPLANPGVVRASLLAVRTRRRVGDVATASGSLRS